MNISLNEMISYIYIWWWWWWWSRHTPYVCIKQYSTPYWQCLCWFIINGLYGYNSVVYVRSTLPLTNYVTFMRLYLHVCILLAYLPICILQFFGRGERTPPQRLFEETQYMYEYVYVYVYVYRLLLLFYTYGFEFVFVDIITDMNITFTLHICEFYLSNCHCVAFTFVLYLFPTNDLFSPSHYFAIATDKKSFGAHCVVYSVV